MLDQYLTDTYWYLNDTCIINPYLTDPYYQWWTDTNRFFNPNQYLPVFNCQKYLINAYIIYPIFNWPWVKSKQLATDL